MDFENEPDFRMLLNGPESFDENQLFENIVDLQLEYGLGVGCNKPTISLNDSSMDSPNWNNGSVVTSPASTSAASSPSASSSMGCASPGSSNDDGHGHFEFSSHYSNPPSNSSTASSTSSNFSVVKAQASTRPKRAATRRNKNTASHNQQLPASSARGRGRPTKSDNEGDPTTQRKRIYARQYRQKHQNATDELFNFAADLYKFSITQGIDVSQKFPQHKKIISKINKTLKF